MITLKQASKTYPISQENQVHAVTGVDLTVNNGEFLIITGRSGSGKTTLLNLLAGLARPSAGQVLWDDVDIWKLDDTCQSRLRSQKVGFIFQFPSLLSSLTALENVALPAMFRDGPARQPKPGRAEELLRQVGLEEKRSAYPRQLSAGQQQRVVVARALFNSPQVLLADEPTSNLDEQTECEIMELFRHIHAATGISIVMVTHTTQLVRFGTRSITMSAGQVAQQVEKQGV